MANKNFEIKNGLTVAGTERITSAGVITGTTATQSASDNTTKLASTAYVTTALANLSDSAPSTLNTLNELAAALGDDANYATTTTNAIAAKLPLAGGTLTGALTTNGVINTGTSHNFALNTPNSLRINIDSNNSATDQIFVIGHNQTSVDNNNALMTILESGNVGIGTSSPAEKLEVKGSIGFEATNSTNRWSAYTYTDNTFRLNYNGAGGDELTLTSDGKLGIGNTSPKALTHIGTLAGGGMQEILRLSGDYSDINTGAFIRFTNQHNSGSNPNTGEYNLAGIKAFDYATDWGGGLALQTAPATTGGGNLTDRLIISPDGDVLVGSSTNLNVLSGTPKLQIGSGTGHSSIQWYSGSDSVAGLYFGDATSGGGRYSGYIEYRHNSNEMAFRTNDNERMKIGSDGYITFTSTRNEYSMELNSAGTRAGLVLNKPGTSSVMGSLLMLTDETYRLGTASNYHIRMDQSGNTYMGNSGTTRFGSTGNLSVNASTMNSGITSGTDVRALGPCFANDANSFTMSQEGSGNTDAYLAARGADGSTRGNIHIGVSVSGGGNFKSGLEIDNQGRSTTPENPAFRYRATAAQVLNSGWQQVGYATLKEERGSNYNTTTSRFTAPVAGWYQFNASWTANNNADTDGTFAICINGSYTDLVGSVSMPDTGGSYDGHSVSGCCYLDVNDYVDVRRYSTVATTTRSSAPYGGWFSGFLIG